MTIFVIYCIRPKRKAHLYLEYKTGIGLNLAGKITVLYVNFTASAKPLIYYVNYVK